MSPLTPTAPREREQARQPRSKANPKTKAQPLPRFVLVPPFENGDRLTQPEFHRLYESMPEDFKAELVEGIVYLGMSVRTDFHGEPHALMVTWLGVYSSLHPDSRVTDDSTIILDGDNEFQPDVLMRRDPADGGSSRINEKGYLVGPPELVVEIAASRVAKDMHLKREVYRRIGVREYLAWRPRENVLDWWRLEDGRYVVIEPDADGCLNSEVFPGLRLDVAALLAGDTAKVLAAISR